jgi:hypothetical protein
VGSIVQSQETSIESISTQPQEEQSTQQIELPVPPPPIIQGIYKSTKFYFIITKNFPLKFDIWDKSMCVYSISEPISDVEETIEIPSSAPTSLLAPPSPPALTSVPLARPLYRKKIQPNIGGVKSALHHRR